MSSRADPPPAKDLQVGEWRLYFRGNELRRGSEVVRLEPKATEVLAQLAAKPGEVVGREELLTAVWPGVVVGDDALTQAIIKLRKALGDDAHAPRYIETVSKRGYRLVAAVSAPGGVAPLGKSERRAVRRPLLAWAAGGAAALAVAIAVLTGLPRMPWPLSTGGRGPPASTPVPTVAILPLANLSGDPAREYFSDGITEDVINALGRFSGVRVMSLGSVQRFKGRAASAREIRDELGARYVVQGSVREADGRLRVTVALSDAESGAQLGSGRHEAQGAQVFDLQDRIVRDIVGALSVKLTEVEQQRGFSRPTESLEAYDLVLQARALIARTDRTANREARALLSRAAQVAPDFADAQTEQGYATFQRVSNGWVEDASSAIAQAEALAQKALAAPETRSHARAHSLLAGIYIHQERYPEALVHAASANELNPSDPTALYWRGAALMCVGQVQEAVTVLETARRYEPHPTAAQGLNLAVAYYLLGRYADSIAQADSLLLRTPTQGYLHAIRAASFARMGDAGKARDAAAQVRRLTPLFDPDDFGAYLGDAKHREAIREGLRGAGL